MNRIAKPFVLVLAAAIPAFGYGVAALAQSGYPASPDTPQRSASGKSLPDSTITSQVRALLKSNGFSDIAVNTEMGVVALTGSVESDQTREALARMVATVEGVKGVDTTRLTASSK